VSIPPATLAALRALRMEQRRAAAPTVKRSMAKRPATSLTGMLKRLLGRVDSPDAEISAAAREYSAEMDRLQAEVEAAFDAFLLDPGMGPMTYLTSDGRILNDNRTWDGEGLEFEASEDRAVAALVVGAKKTGIASLIDIIPKLPDGMPCGECHATRWFRFPEGEIVCPVCFGRGEVGVGEVRDGGVAQRSEQQFL
jgi:hypothetical protein